ncbi:MAG: signal peptide peptidase SppA [Anaerosomatales bacterium]|nr:signal peptide peptidase SppA [Anaerosomatales bacterium]
MSDERTTQPAVPPQAAAAQPSTAPRTKPGRGLAIAVIVLVILVVVACGASCAMVALFSEGTGTTGFGENVALVHINGVIAGTGSGIDGVTTPESIIDQLDQALADDSVKAILLRIDSPGGTVAASQEIAMAVSDAAEEKPVIASVGDVGASGAYMVASQCDTIIAAPGSSVGSIGVILEVPNLQGLLDKLGVEFAVITAGELKDTGSPYRSMTATETAMLQKQVDQAYRQFIRDVAEGRGMSEAEVTELATGWVWLGEEALELGLIDAIGNYSDGLDAAAEAGGIEGDYGVVDYYEYTFDDLIWSFFGLRDSLAPPGAELDDALRRGALPR